MTAFVPTYCGLCSERMTHGVVLPHPDAGFPGVPEWLTMTVCAACDDKGVLA